MPAALRQLQGPSLRADRRDFDIVWSGWAPDYMDAMTFMDVFSSKSPHNSTGWTSVDYDHRLEESNSTIDARKRLALLSEAEHLIIDEVPVIPLFTRYHRFAKNPHFERIGRHPVGADLDFYYVKYLEKLPTTPGPG